MRIVRPTSIFKPAKYGRASILFSLFCAALSVSTTAIARPLAFGGANKPIWIGKPPTDKQVKETPADLARRCKQSLAMAEAQFDEYVLEMQASLPGSLEYGAYSSLTESMAANIDQVILVRGTSSEMQEHVSEVLKDLSPYDLDDSEIQRSITQFGSPLNGKSKLFCSSGESRYGHGITCRSEVEHPRKTPTGRDLKISTAVYFDHAGTDIKIHSREFERGRSKQDWNEKSFDTTQFLGLHELQNRKPIPRSKYTPSAKASNPGDAEFEAFVADATPIECRLARQLQNERPAGTDQGLEPEERAIVVRRGKGEIPREDEPTPSFTDKATPPARPAKH